jgi:hypothetical protein
MMRIICVFLFALFAWSGLGHAQTEGCGTCILYGKDHAFAMTAPPGWILDNKAGVAQGLHQVFYPKGYSWGNSPVIAYSRARSKGAKLLTIEDQVADTVKDFQTDSPNIKAVLVATLALKDGRTATIYHYTGDKWNNYEAVAYIEEKKTINFVVLSSRTKEWFDKSQDTLRAIMESYQFVSDTVDVKK